MLETFFVWAFIILPLCTAVVLIFYRARYFMLGVLAITVAIALVWTVLHLVDRFDRWWWPDTTAELPDCPPGAPIDTACRR